MTGVLTPLAGVADVAVPVALFVLLVVVVVAVFRAVTIVEPYERYVVTDGDRVAEVLEEGVHVRSPLERGVERVDLRTQTFEQTVESVPTADGAVASVTLVQELRVEDAEAAVVETPDYGLAAGSGVEDYQAAVADRTRDVLGARLEERAWEDLAGGEADLAADLERALAADYERWGVALESISIEAVERAD